MEAEQAVRELASWPAARVLRETEVDEADGWSLAAASLLHLEAGLAIAGFSRDDEGIRSGLISLANVQVGTALVERMLAGDETKNRDLRAFCRDWYLVVATTHVYQWGGGAQTLPPALRLLGNDPQIYLFLGTSIASGIGPWRIGDGPYAIGREYDMNGRRVPTLTADGETYDLEEVNRTESAFRKALSLDPSLAEARLRLGRLLQLTNRKKAAQAEFTQVLGAFAGSTKNTTDRFTGYLAGLFLGKVHEDTGNLTAAVTAYSEATARYPAGTAARLALGQVLLASGRERDGLAAARSVFGAETRPFTRDPWTRFPDTNFGQLTQRLAVMRKQVSRTPFVTPIDDVVVADLASRIVETAPSAEAPIVLAAEDRPIFRSTTNGVRVDAIVTDAGRPVTGLSATDFVVTDTGRRQSVASVAVTGALALAVIIDTSESVGRPSGQAQIRRATEAVRSAIIPDDLVSVVSASNRLALRGDLIRGPELLAALFDRIRPEPRTTTAIWDATVAATALVADAPGLALVVIVSDGFDNGSWFERPAAFNRLKRVGLPIDGIGLRADNEALQNGHDIAYGDVSLRPLETVTNGVFFDATDPSLTAKIGDRFTTLRQSYLLMYTPTDVQPQKDGWHEVKVTLRPGLRGRVQARPGYYTPIGKK